MQAHLQQLLSDELERCRAWIQSAIDESFGTHDFDDVAAAVMAGDMQLWPAVDGAMVTEIAAFPRKKVIHVLLAGGAMDTVKALEAQVAEWGKSQGCDMITASGRKGWIRVFDHDQAGVTIGRSL